MSKVDQAVVGIRARNNLAPQEPALIIVDGAPAHNEEVMERVHDVIFRIPQYPTLFIMFTLPNRSHILQV